MPFWDFLKKKIEVPASVPPLQTFTVPPAPPITELKKTIMDIVAENPLITLDEILAKTEKGKPQTRAWLTIKLKANEIVEIRTNGDSPRYATKHWYDEHKGRRPRT